MGKERDTRIEKKSHFDQPAGRVFFGEVYKLGPLGWDVPGEHKPPSTRPGLCSSLFYRLTSLLSIVSLLCGYTAASPSAPAIAFHLKNAENKTVKLSAFFFYYFLW
jgi:hypothetical protein